MTLDINNTDKLAIFQQELSRMQIKLYPPDINNSDTHFTIENNGIKYALGAIKNVGIESMNELIEERKKNGLFTSFDDFLGRVSSSVTNKKTIEALACAGAFDNLKVKRSDIFNQSNEIVKSIKDFNLRSDNNQGDIFGNTEKFKYVFLKSDDWDQATKLIPKISSTKSLSGHPLGAYKESLMQNNVREYDSVYKNTQLHSNKNILIAGTLLVKKEKRSARGNAYAFLNFSDTTSNYEGIIFEANLRKYRDMLIVGQSYVLGADFTDDNGQIRVEIKKVYHLDEIVKFESSVKNLIIKNNLMITTSSIAAVQAIKELDITSGQGTIIICFNNQNIKIGEKFQINDILAEKLRKIPEIISVDLY